MSFVGFEVREHIFGLARVVHRVKGKISKDSLSRGYVVLDVDQWNALKAGYSRGKMHGPVSPNEAVDSLKSLGIPTTPMNTHLFCNGADDGAHSDPSRLATQEGV